MTLDNIYLLLSRLNCSTPDLYQIKELKSTHRKITKVIYNYFPVAVQDEKSVLLKPQNKKLQLSRWPTWKESKLTYM